MEFAIEKIPVVTIKEAHTLRVEPRGASNTLTQIDYELVGTNEKGELEVVERARKEFPNGAVAALLNNDRATINYFLALNSPAHQLKAMDIPAMKLLEPKSGNNNLSVLSLVDVPLVPSFSPDVTEYTAEVSSEREVVDIDATAEHDKATVNIVSNNVNSFVTLIEGINTIVINAVSENGVTKTYTITVTKAAPEVV